METVCDYFDIGYKVLYSDGTKAPSEDGLMDTIRGLVNADNNVLVVVDNVHDNKMAIIFYIIDQLQSFNKIDKITFFLAARQPEYDALISSGIFSQSVRDYKDSILTFNKGLEYQFPPFMLNFTQDEIIRFIDKYIEIARKQYKDKIDIQQEAIKIFEDTKGHPILVKFSYLETD